VSTSQVVSFLRLGIVSFGRIRGSAVIKSLTDSISQGFASGNLEEDGWALQHFLDLEDMELCIAQSFSKNFGLYSERIGAIHVKTNSPKLALKVKGLLEQVTRSEISTPAAFGARIVGAVIDDEQLFDEWMDDLRTMSSRIQAMRKALYHELIQRATPGNWEHILKQVWLF
jgi:aspartate aminotransferase